MTSEEQAICRLREWRTGLVCALIGTWLIGAMLYADLRERVTAVAVTVVTQAQRGRLGF